MDGITTVFGILNVGDKVLWRDGQTPTVTQCASNDYWFDNGENWYYDVKSLYKDCISWGGGYKNPRDIMGIIRNGSLSSTPDSDLLLLV